MFVCFNMSRGWIDVVIMTELKRERRIDIVNEINEKIKE